MNNYLLILIIFILSSTISCKSQGKETPIRQANPEVSATESASKITAKLSGNSRILSPNFSCFNVNSVQIESWQKPEFISTVNRLNPSILRLPGGDVGNYWDWQRGGLIQDFDILPDGLPFFLRFKARQYTNSKLTDYRVGLKGTKTKPIFVLNMLTSNLQSQLKMLETAKELGIPVEYIELGNEFYFNIKNYRQVFPSAREYALQTSQWIAAISQQFPQAKISIVGVVPEPNKPERLQQWNSTLLSSALPQADALTLHIYNGTGLTSQPVDRTTYPWFQASEIPIILGEPFRNWQNLQGDRNFKIIPPNKQIWITEYNLYEDIFENGKDKPEPRVAGSWAHGLYNLSMSLLFLEEPRIELICNHSLLESSIFGAILANDRSFVNPAATNTTTEALSLSATGMALSLLADATIGMEQAQQIDFTDNLSLTGKDGFTYPALYGWKFSKNRQEKGIIINLSEREKTLELNNLFNKTIKYKTLSGSPKSLIDRPGVLQETQGKATDSVILPPYSVVELY
jgi:hypothetical protein